MTKAKLFYILIPFFFLHQLSCQNQRQVSIEKKEKALEIQIAGKPVLTYQYETVYPPAGVDSAYQRSGFIHPLKTLNGHVLTRIQPEDHYHHYGIWNPWTHVLYEGDTLDFWNLVKKEGTVRFAKFENIRENAGEFKVLHEHVVLKDGKEKVALNEFQTIKVSCPGENYYLVDFTFDYACATDSPFKILEYRYGGFGWRATEEWHKGNSGILTSEGKTRVDADSTPARWCIVQGALGNDYGGVVMMSHPRNYNHPEPLRIWPVNTEDRGDVFANISPTKNKDWLIESGNTYRLKYRLAVFDGKIPAEQAEQLWDEYARQDFAEL